MNISLDIPVKNPILIISFLGCVAGDNVLIHVRGPITWVGIYSKALVESTEELPSCEFWENSEKISHEEVPPEITSKQMQQLESGATLRQQCSNLYTDSGLNAQTIFHTLDGFYNCKPTLDNVFCRCGTCFATA